MATAGPVPVQDVPSYERCEPGSVSISAAVLPPSAQDVSASDADTAADGLIRSFNAALAAKDPKAVGKLFLDDGYWRDHLALSWDLRTLKGAAKVAAKLEEDLPLTSIEVDRSSAFVSPTVAPLDGKGDVKGIQFYVTVKTRVGSGRGIARLAQPAKGAPWKIWTLYTVLTSLDGHEEPRGVNRPVGVQHGANPGRKNWLDRRVEEAEFASSDPDVLIVGAGQAGLTVHARLKMLGVPTLIIDKNDAVGDNWRKRYHQLVLHDPVWYDHMPYLNFPDHWPIYTPKDKLGDWFASYAKALELNVWMKSTVVSSTYDTAAKKWTVEVRRTRADGTSETRTLHPKHVIQATGHSGKEHFPKFKGQESFQGDLLTHSSQFPGARDEGKGRKAVVVGACNSSHDICQDYYEHGYDVTMVQRSSTMVMTSEAGSKVLLGGLYGEGAPPLEDADMISWGSPSEVAKAVHRDVAAAQCAFDADTLAGLERAGFKTDRGPGGAGLFFKYLQRGGGYYIDVGASKLIIDGKVRVEQGRGVAEILPRGLRLSDGTELEADEIVFATGYENMQTTARSIFGDAVADKIGGVWGLDAEGELRSLWRKTGQPGFWFHAGNLAICRYFSRILALQIKAQLEGLDA